MHKLSLTSIFLLFVLNSTLAQPYIPMLDNLSNTWYFTINMVGVKSSQQPVNCLYPSSPFDSFEINTTQDSLINGVTYQMLLRHSYNLPFDTCVLGFVREDTASRKVYFMEHNLTPEKVLYDFSMGIGDSILINFVTPGWFYQDGYYVVDSIKNVSITSGVRNGIYLSNHMQIPSHAMLWIESVGHPGNLAYTVSENMDGWWFNVSCNDDIPRDYITLLTCFEHANQKVYFDSCSYSNGMGCFAYADSCHYWNICGSLDDEGVFDEFIISPNPSKGNFTIDIESSFYSNGEFILRRASGEVIKRIKMKAIQAGHNRYVINNEDLAAGLYILEAYTDKGVDVIRVVIVH